MNKTQRICHFTNERVTGAEIRPTVASGIVTGDASVSYWTILSLSLVTIPEVIAKVNSFFFHVSKVANEGESEAFNPLNPKIKI